MMVAKLYDSKRLELFFPKSQEVIGLTGASYVTVAIPTTTAFRFITESDPVKYTLHNADLSTLTLGAAPNFVTAGCSYAKEAAFGIDDNFNFLTFFNPTANTITIYAEKM